MYSYPHCYFYENKAYDSWYLHNTVASAWSENPRRAKQVLVDVILPLRNTTQHGTLSNAEGKEANTSDMLTHFSGEWNPFPQLCAGMILGKSTPKYYRLSSFVIIVIIIAGLVVLSVGLHIAAHALIRVRKKGKGNWRIVRRPDSWGWDALFKPNPVKKLIVAEGYIFLMTVVLWHAVGGEHERRVQVPV